MSALAGAGQLIRLALRLDRVRLPVWVVLLAIMPAGTAAQYQKLYPTQADLRAVEGVVSSPALVALNGPLSGVSLGGLTAWKIAVTELVLVALMSIFAVVRHTRAEEEAGRAELLGAGVTGRHAPLAAALAVAAVADAAVAVLVALGLLGTGLPATGALLFGAAVGLTGLAFAGIAAVAAQLVVGARAATGLAVAVLGGCYLLRAAGDTGPVWLSWLSPLGWAMRSRPFAEPRAWAVLPLVALAAGSMAAAAVLAARRDLSAGLLPQRSGPATGTLGGPLALAWRLHRGLLLGWTAALAVGGATMGGAARGIGDGFTGNQQIVDLLTRLGGSKGVTDAFLAAVFGIIGVTAAAYTVQATLRLRAEESAGHLEAVLATGTGRTRWALSHLAFAVLGTVLLLAAAGLGAGLAYGSRVPQLLGDALVQAPAAWVLGGFGTALFGLAPRLAPLAWAGLVACVVILEVGALSGLSPALLGLSPFAHVPKLPGSELTVTPLLGLTAIAAGLGAAGLAAFRRRDLA